jgi:transmembrane 9 superfamily protein 2/4
MSNYASISNFFIFRGDHKWWWKSYFLSGSVGLYIAGYAIYYYLARLRYTRFSSLIMYFGYMSLFSMTLFLISGALGFLITFAFLRKIYSMIKID